MTGSAGWLVFTRLGAAVLVAAGTISVGGVASAGSPEPSVPRVSASGFEFLPTASLRDGRIHHTATLLGDGRVLVIGGYEAATAEIWDPVTGEWSAAGSMAGPREEATATLLEDGRVLVVGGHYGSEEAVLAEVWDPVAQTFRVADPLLDGVPVPKPRVPAGAPDPANGASVTAMLDGRVLIAGGREECAALSSCSPPILDTAEVWDPATGIATPTASMVVPRTEHTATLLPDGRILMVGNHTHGPADQTAELFQPKP